MKNIGTYQDTIIGVSYKLELIDSAKELSNSLKKTYKNMDINFDDFNTSLDGSDVSENPPAEIYEYQNFFLLEKIDGTKILLDGFRRLLWYNSPDTPIIVRTYYEKDLSDKQILNLLVHLNHFKFYGLGSYQERGFGLFLKAMFNIDITGFRKAFDAYLSSDKIKNDYLNGGLKGSDKMDLIKERILGNHFVSDIKFLSELNDNDCMVNSFFGALVFQKRQESNEKFSAKKFLELHNSDKVLSALITKYKNIGTNSSAKSQAVVNQIQEIYNNYFTLMFGGEIELSYAEKVQQCKDLRVQINKDKNWTKLTGHKETYKIELAMMSRLKETKKRDCLKFKCIVMPKGSSNGWSSEIPLKYGLNQLVQFIKMSEPESALKSAEIILGFKDPETNVNWTAQHNYGGWNSYGKKYTTLQFEFDEELSKKYGCKFSSSYDIELWVDIPKKEWINL